MNTLKKQKKFIKKKNLILKKDFKNLEILGIREQIKIYTQNYLSVYLPLNLRQAITNLKENNLIFTGSAEEMVEYLNIVRFKNNKSKFLVALREQMTKNGEIVTKDFFSSIPTTFEKREWIVKNIKGMSYKEAGHFLRNVGFGSEVAILDRHILRNLVKLEVIDEIPKTLSPKIYL